MLDGDQCYEDTLCDEWRSGGADAAGWSGGPLRTGAGALGHLRFAFLQEGQGHTLPK